MTKTIVVKPNQTLLDIILMEYGTLEAGMFAAKKSNIPISLLPDAGNELELPVLASFTNSTPADSTTISYFKQNGIVVGTKGIAVPLTLTVILKPRMTVAPNIVGVPHIIGFYSYDFIATPDFVNVYDLIDNYLTANDVSYETEELYLIGVPSHMGAELYATPMPDKSIPYKLAWTVGLGYMMVWTPPSAPIPSVTFKDVEGNAATVAPFVILSNSSQDLILYLIADIDVELISSTPSMATIRLTRHHPPSFVPDFNTFTMAWIAAAAVAVPDPDDPLNEDRRILTVPHGNYSIGVKTVYQHSLGAIFPSSIFTMVINLG